MVADFSSSPERHSLGSGNERLRHKWIWIVAFGLLLDLAGLVALGSVVLASVVTVLIIGIMMLSAGVIELGMSFHAQDRPHFWLWLLGGILYIGAGIFAIVNPILALTVLTLLLGAGLVAAGVVRLILAFRLPASQPRPLIALTGVLTLLVGLIIVIHWPVNSLFILGILLGLDLMFHGIGWILFGLMLRTAHRRH